MIPMTLGINVRRGNKQAAVAVVAFGIVVDNFGIDQGSCSGMFR
jgi:hypothetical protein